VILVFFRGKTFRDSSGEYPKGSRLGEVPLFILWGNSNLGFASGWFAVLLNCGFSVENFWHFFSPKSALLK
jgi:hypothetical protein